MNAGNVEVDLTLWNRAIPELARIGNRDPVLELQLQSKLLIRQIMDFTPPKTMAQGRKAIKQDLSRVFIGFDDDDQDFQNLQGERVVRTFVDKKGYVYGQDVQLYRPEAGTGEMQQHHRSMRSPITGRVTKAGTRTRDIGRWKFLRQMIVSKRALREYTAEVWSHVGWMKAGWAVALRKLKGSMPGWVSRHSVAPGLIVSQLTGASPFIMATNNARGITLRGKMDARIRDAVDSRLFKMARDLEVRIQKSLKRSRYWWK